MLKNHLQIALRNFRRNKVFSIINISGLAIGISAALVIYLIVHYEFSYEKFQKDGDRVYRVVSNMHFPNQQDFKNAGVPGPLPAAARAEIASIEKSSAFWNANSMKVTVPSNANSKKEFKSQDDIAFADDDYFRFFHYQWLAGNPDKSLSGPNKIVLTESRAQTYFPFADITNAIGQTIIYNDTVQATVTGIVKDLDEITDFTFKEFVSFPTFKSQLIDINGWDDWGNVSSSSQFFVLLKEGTDTSAFNKQIAAIRKKNEKDAFLATDHFLQPLYDIHFNSDFDAFDHRQAHRPTMYGLLAVAAFLLLLGCINFINLTTAQASQRAKEIGIRKTMGSSRSQLVFQFLTETLMVTIIAAVVSISIIPSLLKIFSAYIPQGLHFNLSGQPDLILFVIVLILFVSALSGIYPALVLSGYRPVLVLKNVAYANTAMSRRVWVRKTLTVAQFVIAQFLIVATLVVGKQIRYSLNTDMGFKKDAIINFSRPQKDRESNSRIFALQQKLKSIPGIQEISVAGRPPADKSISSTTVSARNITGKDVETTVEVKQADSTYFDLYKIKFVAGRTLQTSDTLKEYVVNETFARQLGFTDPSEIIGHTINRSGKLVPIVGVIADIHTKSLHAAIQPIAFSQGLSRNVFHVALRPKGANTDSWKSTIASIGTAFREVYPDEDFSYQFFDESIAKFYENEQDTASLLAWCSGLAIFISCLGLLGLVIYTTAQRRQEIGVRKVLGASVTQIISLLSKDFIRLVFLAFVISAPVAWWAMSEWLNDYAYRTQFNWWIFALSGGLMFIIALITLSIQTIRSAVSNPVESLRAE